MVITLLACPAGSYAKDLVIGTVIDGPQARPLVTIETLAGEIQALVGDEYNVKFPEARQLQSDWTMNGARSALERQLAIKDVDLVVTTGRLASSVAAQAGSLAKPVIGLFDGDSAWQTVPMESGRSGKQNFVYLQHKGSLDSEIEAFHSLTDFRHVAMLVDESWRRELPELVGALQSIADRLGATATLVAVPNDPLDAVASIPDSADAVFLAPLRRQTAANAQRLIDELNARQLPTFSSLGVQEIEMGTLGSAAGSQSDPVVVARRVALLIERILNGADPAELSVAYGTPGRLALNMRTASAINFSPGWSSMDSAELLFQPEVSAGESLSLVQAMQRAANENLELNTARFDVELAQDNIRLARAPLKPQFELGVRHERVDANLAEFGVRPERSTDAELVASQVLYSEERFAAYGISKKLADAAEQSYRSAFLDTLTSAATRYLNLLRAGALENVTRSNVEVTRTNLRLARMREEVGYSGRSEVLRWQSQIARDSQSLATAVAQTEQAATALNNVLSVPLDGPIRTSEAHVDRIVDLVSSSAFQRFVDTPRSWHEFQNFYAEQAVDNSPEIAGLRARIQAQQRQLKADRRTLFVPEVRLEGRRSRSLNRSGANALAFDDALGENEWSIGLQLSLPVYSGGALRTRVSQARTELRQLRNEEAATRELLEARVRGALQSMRGSFPAIEYAAEAAAAARQNLELVTDQYQRGAVSVTDLIDAQEASLQADLAAADARYAFLLDFVAVQRASGSLDLLMDPSNSRPLLQELENFFSARGLTSRPRTSTSMGEQS